MLAQEYYDFKAGLNRRGIVFSFAGYVSEGILFALGDALKRKMAIDAMDRNVAKRVFSVFVEQVQNIIRYSAERIPEDPNTPEALSSGTISVGVEQERFFVVCGNVIQRDDKACLQARLEYLAALDRDGLRAYYRQKLKEPTPSDAPGGSIGLIEIARRSSAPIEFDFLDLAEDRTFFCLKAYI
jgi:hypothetical protein